MHTCAECRCRFADQPYLWFVFLDCSVHHSSKFSEGILPTTIAMDLQWQKHCFRHTTTGQHGPTFDILGWHDGSWELQFNSCYFQMWFNFHSQQPMPNKLSTLELWYFAVENSERQSVRDWTCTEFWRYRHAGEDDFLEWKRGPSNRSSALKRICLHDKQSAHAWPNPTTLLGALPLHSCVAEKSINCI